VTHSKASDSYRHLGYPDLAAGAAYKALLLVDAIDDESDEFHDAAVGDLDEYVSTLDIEQQSQPLQAYMKGSSDINNREERTSLILEEMRLQM
jgi:hypothetical protein